MSNTSEKVLAERKPALPCLAMRAREAAAALGISERTLWAWTAAGEVPHIRRGGVLLYPVDALREWLAKAVEGTAGVTPR